MFNDLYDDQKEAFIKIMNLLINKRERVVVFRAAGGTGKTVTLRAIGNFLQQYHLSLTCMALAGRAAGHLAKTGLNAGTIHSFMYTPILDHAGNLIRFDRKEPDEIRQSCGDIIAVDEGSMLNQGLYNDVMSIGLPVIICGDYDQLEPINDPSKGDDKDFNPMVSLSAPVVSLAKIRRFDEKSGIGFICSHLRQTNSFPRVKKHGLRQIRKNLIFTKQFFEENKFDVVVCGTNSTRRKLNNLIRSANGYNTDTPQVGERVICLKNDVVNNHKINNGEMFEVTGVMTISKEENRYALKSLDRDDTNIWVIVPNETWSTEKLGDRYNRDSKMQVFGFGYALSCHKVQGSSFNSVLVVDEDVSYFLDQRRYRYTACSRAMTELTIAL